MKKYMIITVVSVFTMVLLILIAGISSGLRANATKAEEGESLPDFTLATTGHKRFCSSEIKGGPLLIVHFNPECEHCRYEIRSMIHSSLPSLGYRVLLITEAPADSVMRFIKADSLGMYSSFTVLLDTAGVFSDKFGSSFIPANFIYDKELRLVKALEGEYKTVTLIRYLSDNE